MDNPEKNPSVPPEEPSNEEKLSRTQPGRRLRKLLAGSQENDAMMNSAAGAAPSEPPAQGEPPDAAEVQAAEAEGQATPPPAPSPEPTAPAGPPASSTEVTTVIRSGPPASTTDVTATVRRAPAEIPPDQAETRPFVPDQTRPNVYPNRATLPQEPSQPPPPFTPQPYSGENTPLPQHVEETDPNATRVTPAAYQSTSSNLQQTRPSRGAPGGPVYPSAETTRPSRGYQQGNYPPPQSPPPPPPAYSRSVGVPGRGRGAGVRAPNGRSKSGFRRTMGCLLRLTVAVLFLVVFVIVAAGSWLVFQYTAIRRDLPTVDQLRTHAAQFETTRIYDRNGDVLYEIIDPNAGRRTFVPISKISPNIIAATLATEDKEFYNHPGFDPLAIARAFWQNYTTGNVVSGASTITQQLARALLLAPEERNQRTYERKAREIVLSAEITRHYTKDEILELYLNEIYYGNLSYGIEAASETYFGVTADKLTLAQASFLAGLPQSPGVYDIFTNRDETLRRQKDVILLMLQDSQEKGCIPVGSNVEPVCVSDTDVIQAVQYIEGYAFHLNQAGMRYPHWVTYIRSLLEAQYDPQTIYRSGFNVYTTLDAKLQDQAQAIISQQVEGLANHNAHNGALVAIQPATGEILAMVGSPNFGDNQHAGQVNMAISPRQPGSSFKPLTYAAAFEKGWTPATLIWDVPTDFPPSGDPNDTRPPYQPVNYDGRFHGPVTVRTALANSYNIPAVKTLQFVGIYGNNGVVSFARRMGINTLDRKDYGLALTLGGGEVTLLDMTSAFGVFADGGQRVPPVAITKITDFQGNLVFQYQPPQPQQVIRPEHAFLISSILSDNEARTPAFGANSVLHLPFQAAAKTGTTNDFRDNWTLGFTPDLAVGVWVGNADFTPMQDVTGVTGAAPAWSKFMKFAVPELTGGNPRPFQRPPGIVEKVICAVSGTEPSEFCTQQRSEFFANDQPPRPKEEDLWKKLKIDTWTGLQASSECPDFTEDSFTLNVNDTWAVNWIKDTDQGRAWAESVGFPSPITFVPKRECKTSDPRPQVVFSTLSEGQPVTTSPLDIYAVVKASANFKDFRLEWGAGDDPKEWKTLLDNNPNQFGNPERIYSWDLTKDVPAGVVTLRIWIDSTDADRHAEKRIHLNLNVPTPTPTATPTATITPTASLTPMPTNTPPPTQTAQPTLTPVPATASPTASPTPSHTP